MKTLTVLAAGLAFVLSGSIASAGSSQVIGSGSVLKGGGNEIRVEVRLDASNAFPRAGGKAKFRDRGGERELQIEVEDGPANTLVVFFVGGVEVGEAMTDAFGDARIALNTDLGDDVPTSVAGDDVTVETANGIVIVSGSF